MTNHIDEKIFDPAQPISEPGVYVMTEDQYHADPCATPSLSSSIGKKCLPMGTGTGTARHMWQAHPKLNPPDPDEGDELSTKRFDLGSVFHTLILGKGAEIEVIDAKDWRTKDAKAARDAALAANRQPVIAEQMARARAMLAAAIPQVEIRPELAAAMSKGRPERVLVWREESPGGPILCRCMLDWLPDEGEAFPDWKTTGASAGPDDYGRTYFDIGADFQDAFYRRGIRAVLGRRARLIFPVIETAEPHCLMVHQTMPMSLAMADRKVTYAINLFGLCLQDNIWPGFPVETASQEAPPWIENKWTDREDAGMTGTDFTSRMIESLKDMPRGTMTFDREFAEDFGLTAHEDAEK